MRHVPLCCGMLLHRLGENLAMCGGEQALFRMPTARFRFKAGFPQAVWKPVIALSIIGNAWLSRQQGNACLFGPGVRPVTA